MAAIRGIGLALTVLIITAAAGFRSAAADSAKQIIVKTVKGQKLCDQDWECKGLSKYCCNQTISDFFQTYQFEDLFAKRNTPVAHAAGFWDYKSFITAAAVYQPHGFGTHGGLETQMKEVAAFLGHVGAKTSCKQAATIFPPCIFWILFDYFFMCCWFLWN